MIRRWLGSVRVRTTLAATLVTAIVLIGGSIAIVRVVEDDLLETAGKGLRQALDEVGVGEAGGHGDRQRVVRVGTRRGERLLAFWRPDDDAERVEGMLLGTDSAAPVRIVIDPETNDVLVLEDPAGRTVANILGPIDLRGIDFEEEGDDDDGEGLFSEAALEEVREGVDAVANALLLIVPALILILGATTWFVVGRALRPVHAISARVAAIDATTLDERVPVPDADDEIAELAGLMNQMLDRLEAGSARQRRFVADASHELRSPLATITAAAEVAQASSDPTRFGQLADEVAAESARMEALISDLLDLARLDEQAGTPSEERVELRPLVEDVVDRIQTGSIELDVAVDGDPAVLGSSAQLSRAITNLLVNGVAHARSHISVAATQEGSRAIIRVDDDGPGIAPADRERVFERFVRLDSARGRESGGAGIGLSLVRAIGERHEGTVRIEEAPELGGARFVLDLPADGERSSG